LQPAFRAHYPWTSLQNRLIDKELEKGKSFTHQHFLHVLDTNNLRRGITEEVMLQRIHAHSMSVSRWEGRGKAKQFTLGELHELRDRLQMPPDVDDPRRLHLLPLRDGGSHIIVDNDDGVDFKQLTGQAAPHKKLSDGTPYAFCFPLASRDSLSLVRAARELVYHKFVEVTRDGPQMEEVTGIGLALIDGIWSLVRQNLAGIIRIGVKTKSGVYADVAIALVSGESRWCVAVLGSYPTATGRRTNYAFPRRRGEGNYCRPA
jgi:hypothetical protein